MADQETIYTVDLHLSREADKSAQDDRFAAERQAFWSMHLQLLERYERKYVAILNSKVVDLGRNVLNQFHITLDSPHLRLEI